MIAFFADNPGYWFLHCHIEVHQLEGMAVIIQEQDESRHNYNLPQDINKPGKFNWTINDFCRLVGSARSSFTVIYTIHFVMLVIVLLIVL